MRKPKYVPRFRPEQETWIARARAAPTHWSKIKTAKATTDAIVEQLQATSRENKNG
jgi:hypothetical protein